MKVLLILIILFIMSVYSNTILYGGQSCSTEIETNFQNTKTKFNILQNKIKEIENVYNNFKKKLHNKLKQFHLISNQNNLNNTLDGYKTYLKNEVLNLNSINLNLYGGQLSSICKLKTKMTLAYNVLDKSLSIFLKAQITKYKKQSLIDIENWYNDIKNNLLTSNFEKTDDYDDKIFILDNKYGYTNKINIQYLNNLNQITKNNNNLITDIKINTNPFKEDDVFTSLNTSPDIKLHVVNFKELLPNSDSNFLPIINNNAFHFNFGLYNMNTDKPYIETDFDLSNLKKINIIDKNNNIYEINIYNKEYKYYIYINNIYEFNYFTTQIKIKNYLDTLNKKKIINDYYITPLKNDLKYINNNRYNSLGYSTIGILCAGIIYTDFISKIPDNKTIYDRNFYIYNTDIGPYIPKLSTEFQKIHSLILNNQQYDFDKFFNYFNHPKYSENGINYYLRKLYETPTTIIDRFDNTKKKPSNKLRDYIKFFSSYFQQLCTDDKSNPNDKIIHLESFFNNKITAIDKSLRTGFFENNSINTYDPEYNDSFYNLIKDNIEKIIIFKECTKPFKKIKEAIIYEGLDDKIYINLSYYHQFNILFYQTKVFHNIYESKEGFNLIEGGEGGSGSFKLDATHRSVYDKLKIENILVDHYVGYGGTYRDRDLLYKRVAQFSWLQYFIYRYFEAFSHSILPLSTPNFFTNMNNNNNFDLQFKEERNGFYYPTNIKTSYIPRQKYYVSNDSYVNRNIQEKSQEPTLSNKNISKYVPYDWITRHGSMTWNTYNYMHYNIFVSDNREIGLRDSDELKKSITGPAYIVYNKISGNNITLFKNSLVNENINILENEFILGIKTQSNFDVINDFYLKSFQLVFEDSSYRYIYQIINLYNSTNQSYKFYIKIRYVDYQNKTETEPTNHWNNRLYEIKLYSFASSLNYKLIHYDKTSKEIKDLYLILQINYKKDGSWKFNEDSVIDRHGQPRTRDLWLLNYYLSYNLLGYYISNVRATNLETNLDINIIFHEKAGNKIIYFPKAMTFQTYIQGNKRDLNIYTNSRQMSYYHRIYLEQNEDKNLNVQRTFITNFNIITGLFINTTDTGTIKVVTNYESCTHVGYRFDVINNYN